MIDALPPEPTRKCGRTRRCRNASGALKQWWPTKALAKAEAPKWMLVYECPYGGWHFASVRSKKAWLRKRREDRGEADSGD